MKKWTFCQYDEFFHLANVTMIEGGMNPRRLVVQRSQACEREHEGCVAIEVEGGFENCPIGLDVEGVALNHPCRGK